MIGLNDFQRQWAETGADVLAAVERVGRGGWYILGRNVTEFEAALASYWNLPYAVGVASGLDAIELSLRAAGCGPGDYVLTAPISAFATVLAIIKTGAAPVFADCDEHGLVDLDLCRDVLQSRPEIRFFVPVHLYGHCLDLSRLKSLAADFDLTIIEDCAQSIGALYAGMPTGSVGRFAATSFYPTKNLGALGDGGAVLTHNSDDARSIAKLRDYGQSGKYKHDVLGYNSRLDELHAAILNSAFLPRLPRWIDERRRIARRYLEEIRNPAITVPGAPANSDSCWHLFPILIEPGRKQDALAYFRSREIAVGEHYPLAVTEQHALDFMRDRIAACPRAEDFCHREISLPIHPYLTPDEISGVIHACNEWH